MTRKATAIVEPVTHGQPEQVFDKIGQNLANILDKQAESRELIEHLWQLYLMDCNRHGVKPVLPKKTQAPALKAFPCNICKGTYDPNPLLTKRLSFNCQECGRKVCQHAAKFKPLCYDCASPPVDVVL